MKNEYAEISASSAEPRKAPRLSGQLCKTESCGARGTKEEDLGRHSQRVSVPLTRQRPKVQSGPAVGEGGRMQDSASRAPKAKVKMSPASPDFLTEIPSNRRHVAHLSQR